MAQQHLNVGTVADDGTGDPLRTSLQKTEANFTDLYALEALKAPLASPALTGTPTAPTAAPGTSTTQIATTAFVAAIVTGLLKLKGNTDCSANPNYPAAVKGDSYVVSVAGKIGGASGVSVDVGDVYAASADNAGGTQASVGASWFVLEHNLAGALLAANNLSDLLNAGTARTNLGLGTMATQAAGSVAITGGSVAGITDLAVADGGTGASTASAARTNLGAAASGANSDILSLAGLTTPLSIAQGGTAVNTLAALLTKMATLVQPLYVAGRWYWAERAVNSTGVVLGTNQIRLNCFLVKRSITVSDLFARVTTVSAGGNFQLAVYAADAATMLPTGNPVAATGNISTTTAGAISGDITGADVALAPGLYWVGVNADNNVAVLQGNGAGPIDGALVGSATLANLVGLTLIRFVAQTFGTWPDLTSASLTENGSVPGVALGFKVSVGG